ncbi:MAG: hypothetical protein IH991_20795 [Planctomycetes bacterium]|nr:hypothetical protein [Planctomycetota bacterium]
MREIRRRTSLDGILAFVDQVAEMMGGRQALASHFAEALQRDDAPITWRIKVCQTLLHMSLVAEQMQLSQVPFDQPAVFLRIMHEDRKLFPALRALRADGTITFEEFLDGIDPPPPT